MVAAAADADSLIVLPTRPALDQLYFSESAKSFSQLMHLGVSLLAEDTPYLLDFYVVDTI